MSYTSEKNVQMLIYLMKEHGIRRVIASPGTTNITFIASVQKDSYFEIYSAADERSAAYIACGMAAESGEPVALTCTGATASRNYVPGLTEAYYRKLPVLAITSTQHTGRIGNLQPQVIDRSVIQNDIAVYHTEIPFIHDKEDEWDINLKINRALLALKHRGGGPVHINLETRYTRDFSVEELPKYRKIERITVNDSFPEILNKKVAVFVGSHKRWDAELTHMVDRFCESYDAIVICDHTSNYHGKYGIQFNLISDQSFLNSENKRIELLIDMGEMSGAYMGLNPSEVWRVNSDGEIRDTYKKITKIFDMEEIDFFKRYAKDSKVECNYYNNCKQEYNYLLANIPDLPFSNIWLAQNTAKKLPTNSIVHLGILNSLRSWNFFEFDPSIDCYCNTGGFGIDGIVSSFIGSALASKDKMHYLIIGDLAFFYDLNAIANRNIPNNIRILLVNNGCGTEFKNYNHFAATFGEEADEFIAARGHYGNQSPNLVKDYSIDLGFKYLTADSKEKYLSLVDEFISADSFDKPIMFEVFTNSTDESDALKMIKEIIQVKPNKVKDAVKNVLGEKGTTFVKRMINR